MLAGGLAVVAGGVAVAVVVLAARGGESPLTPAQYLARANAACRPYARQLDRITPPDLASPKDVAASVGRALPVLQAQADAVRRIKPPRELRSR